MQAVGILGVLALLGACAPDRLYVEGSEGWGEIEPEFKDGTYDTESYAVTVGLSFPIGMAQERAGRCSHPERYLPPAAPTEAPMKPGGQPLEGGQDIPWEALVLLLSGAAGWEGSKAAYKKAKPRFGKKPTAPRSPVA